MTEKLPTCSVDGCHFLATQGETCLKHRPVPEPYRVRPEWAEYVKRTVDAAPPLTRAQRDKIAVTFAKARGVLQ